MYYIPLAEMRGEKKVAKSVTTLKDWAWAYPTYELALEGVDKTDIKSVTIDPKKMMADVNKENNTWQFQE
jgi:hypothetical protein